MKGAYLLLAGVLSGCALWGEPVVHARRGPGRLTLEQRAKSFRQHTLSKGALARSSGTSALGAVVHPSSAWGTGAAAVGRRTASGMAAGGVAGALQFAVGAARHELTGYQRCPQSGAWTRTKYAMKNTFLVRREGHPGKSVAAGRMSGAMGAGLISRLWQPATLGSVGAGVASAGVALGAGTGMNVLREFWPDIVRRLGRKNKNGAARAAPRRQTQVHAVVSMKSKPLPPG